MLLAPPPTPNSQPDALPLPVMLDVDTGFDDALALLLALRSPRLDVRGVTCVAGNHRLEQVTRNTLKVLDVAGAGDIPVAAGMARALLEPLRLPMALHGRDGMADLDLPESPRRVADCHAVELIRAVAARAERPVTLIALAPLTNVACALRMYPRLAEQLAGIMIMGGALAAPGNTSAVAEFNIRCDPEAAAIVFAAPVPITLYPLDVFMQVGIARGELGRFCAGGDPAARLAGDILNFSCEYFKAPRALMGDAGAVAAVIAPELTVRGRYRVAVELAGEHTRGQTILDRRSRGDAERLAEWAPIWDNEIEVVESIDLEGCRRLFAETLGVGL